MTPIEEQYKNDVFRKMSLTFVKGKKLLDVGCGDCLDDEIFIDRFGLRVYGIDLYKHKRAETLKGFVFKRGNIYRIPFKDKTFDYVFLHDVLHHIDERQQRENRHAKALSELSRVCKKGGEIIIVEANRFNPLLYPHMVLLNRHNHFRQDYFERIVKKRFSNVAFKHFEAHAYPPLTVYPFRIFEFLMEKIPFLKPFLAYNVAIVKNV